nr:MAG TPA: hypothetical protein [Caudoviricetes sp.]
MIILKFGTMLRLVFHNIQPYPKLFLSDNPDYIFIIYIL